MKNNIFYVFLFAYNCDILHRLPLVPSCLCKLPLTDVDISDGQFKLVAKLAGITVLNEKGDLCKATHGRK